MNNRCTNAPYTNGSDEPNPSYSYRTYEPDDNNINNLSGNTSISNSSPNPEVNYAHDNQHLNYLQNHQKYLQHQHYERPKYSALGSSSAGSPRLILSPPIDAHDHNMVPELYLHPHSYHYHQQHHQVHPLYDGMGLQRYGMTMPPTNHAKASASSSSTTMKSPFTNDYSINTSSGGARRHNSGQKASALNTRRSKRTVFTEYQLEVLENTFRKDKYPNAQDILNLSTQLNLTQRSIDTWFKNRRVKDNRMKKDKSDKNLEGSKNITNEIEREGSSEDHDTRRKKYRLFTEYQLEVLENTFRKDKYPNPQDKLNLSTQLNVDESRIDKWFDNRRAKDQRMKKYESDKNLESSKNIPYELEKEVSGVDHYSRSSRAPRLYPISSMQSGLQCDGRNSGGVTMGSFVSENYVPPGGFTGQNMNVREVSDQHVPHNTGGNLVAQPGFDYGLRNDSEPAQQKYSSQDDDPDFCSELKMPTPIPYKTSMNLPTATPNEKPRLFEMLPYDEDYYHHYGLSNHGLIDYRDSDDYRYYDYYDYAPMEDRDCPSI